MINQLVFENIRHRPIRAMLSVLLIGVPVTLILTIAGLSEGMLSDSKRRAVGIGADVVLRPPGTSLMSLSGAPLSEKLVGVVAKEPHVVLAAGSIIHPQSGFTSVTGIDLAEFNAMSGGFKYLEGGPFEGPDDIIIDEYIARERKVAVNGKLEVMNRPWRICGIVESGKLARLVLPLKIVQELTGNTGKISQIYLKLDDEKNAPAVVASLKQRLPDYPIYSMREFTSLLSVDNVPGLKAFIYVVEGIAVVIAFSVVCLSMYMSVLQRTREIGILKSLGASRLYIIGIILREALIFAVGGCGFGIVLSFGARWLILKLVPASLSVAIVPGWWPVALGISLVSAALGSLYPGWHAASEDPIEALSYE